MKKLLYKFIILFLLVLVPLITIILLPASHNNYLFALIDKHQRLINTESPRIVLAGGSNLAFGIDSKMIQEALNVSVINTGIHAGIGLGRILDDIAPHLHTGDILVIAPEYSHFTGNWNGSDVVYELVFDMRNYPLIMHQGFYGLPSGNSFFSYAKNKALALIPRPTNPLAYSRDGFNEYGDYVKHLEVENQPFDPGPVLEKIDPSYLSAFFRIVDSLVKQGVQVLITYPSYEETAFQNSVDTIHEIDAAFRKKQNMAVISIPENYCFPTDYFYDTTYHLNARGRKLRTERLIQDLQQQLGPPRRKR